MGGNGSRYGTSTPPRYANGRLFFDVALDPGETWHACINFIALADGDVLEPKHTSADMDVTAAGKVMANFLDLATQLQSSNREIAETYKQALIDMGALRIEVEDNERSFWMPAAGIPWFVAVFGRDSIIASLQTMAVSYEFGRGTLVRLAQLQAGDARVALRFWRKGEQTEWNVTQQDGELTVYADD